MIDPGLIDSAVGPMLEDPGIELRTLKTRITDEEEFLNPNAVKVVADSNDYALYFKEPGPVLEAPF